MVLKEYALQYASYMRYEPNTTTEELAENTEWVDPDGALIFSAVLLSV